MAKESSPRERAANAHVDFIHHDVHCQICSDASRYGARWKDHVCPTGLALFAARAALAKADGK